MTNEIECHEQLHHANICRLFQVPRHTLQRFHLSLLRQLQTIETQWAVYLVMEYVSGGELFDYILSRKRCKVCESLSRSVMHHCHIYPISGARGTGAFQADRVRCCLRALAWIRSPRYQARERPP